MAEITTKHLQLLRNGAIKASKAEAISAVTSALTANAKVGEPALGIYEVGSNKYAVLGINVSGQVQIIEGVEATQAAIDAALASAKTYTNTSIQELKVTDTAVEGEYVSAVSEADGKISVSRVALPSAPEVKVEGKAIVSIKEDKGLITATAGDIAAAHVTIADAGGKFDATNVEDALSELLTKADTNSEVTLEAAEGTGNVLKVYTIKQGGVKVGDINIPKDLVVTSGSVVKGNWSGDNFTESETGTGTALKLVIANQTAPVYINTLDLVKDHTAGNGIAISDTNVVSVVVDPASEFLSVGANGVKLSGVSAHVAAKIGELDSTVSSATNAKVVVEVVEENGKLKSVSIDDKDIASRTLLGTTSDTKDSATAFGFIAKEAADRAAAISGLNANVDSTGGTHVKVNVVESAGKVTSVAVTENDIAQKSVLDAEIEHRKAVEGQSGATYTKNTGATYINTADSLNNADVLLDAAVKANADKITAEATKREEEDGKLNTRLTNAEALLGIVTGSTSGTSVDKKISDAIQALDSTKSSTDNETTKAVVTVVETDGLITSVVLQDKDIASAKLLGAADATGDTTAFGKIKLNAEAIAAEKTRAESAETALFGKIDVLNGSDTTAGSVAKSIKDAIEGLDVAAVGGNGTVIATVSEQDGKISATTIDLTAANVAATAINGDNTHVAVTGTTVASQIDSLAQSVKSVGAAAKSYSVKKLSQTEVEGLGDANVKEAYQLIDEKSAVAGETIKIYKDSSLKEVKLVGQELQFTYILANGNENTVGVDVSTFLAESEFSDGLGVVDHVVKVKIDADSEGFLTVGEGGVKLSGVQTAIDTAANKAATEVVEDATGHVTVTKTTGANNQAIYTIGENDIASEAALNAEVTRAQAAEDAIEAAVGLNANGTYAQTSGANYTDSATTVVGAIAALDAQAKVNATAISDEKSRAEGVEGEIKGLIGNSGVTGGTTVYGKINENAAAIATLNGGDTVEGSVAKAISDLKSALVGGASAGYDTFKELETAIKAVSSAAIKVAAGNGIEITETGTTKTIAVKADNKSIKVDSEGVKVNLVSNGPIVLDGANGLTLGTWDLGNY